MFSKNGLPAESRKRRSEENNSQCTKKGRDGKRAASLLPH
jgi:hypothetical protein